MLFKNVSLKTVSCVDAPHIISSAEIERQLAPILNKIGSKPDLIERVAGIKNRRFWDPGVQPSEVATEAGRRAIEQAGIDKDKIGLLINTSVCKDYIEPSVASLVHGNLELSPHCMNFDVGDACLGFMDGMALAGQFIESGQIEYALIVDGESSRDVVEATIDRMLNVPMDEKRFRLNFATLTLGSGAAAAILCRSDAHPEAHSFTGGYHYSHTKNNNRLCLGQRDEMLTDSSGLMIAGLEAAIRCNDMVMNQHGWKDRPVDEIVIHQVSAVNTQKLAQAIDLDMDKLYLTFPEYGNIGPAAIPINLFKAHEAGRIKKGDRILFMGMGSGINCCIMELIW